MIFFSTGVTFTDPLTCSSLVLSFVVTPYVYRSILISFTSSLHSWLFVVHNVSAPCSNADLTVLCIFPFSFTGIFLSHNTPLHFFEVPSFGTNLQSTSNGEDISSLCTSSSFIFLASLNTFQRMDKPQVRITCCINGYCCYCRLNHKSPDSSSMNELFVGPTTFWRFLSTLEHLYNDKAVCRTKTVNRLKYVLGGHVISLQTHSKRL